MSIATVNEAHPEASLAMPPKEHSAKPSYKSNRQVIIRFVAYHLAADKSSRKKYLKSRHVFKAKMRDSNTLFEHEQRTTQIADRLQEQLDQFLDLLHELNASDSVPAPLRYNLSPTPSPSAVPSLEPDEPLQPNSSRMNASTAASSLEQAHLMFSRGQISPARYQEIEAQLHPYIHNPTPIASLFTQVPHTILQSVPLNTSLMDLSSENPTYLSSTHEDAYLHNLDAAIISSSYTDQDVPLPIAPKKENHPLSVKDSHKDLSIRNPVSAYNWLRKHKPDLFASMQLSDLGLAEPGQERKPKPSPKPNTPHPKGGNGKRERPSGAVLKSEPEMLDDEGNLIGGGLEGAGASAVGKGGKRKRGEDEPYRPKGGSSRTTKRKRAGTGGGGRGGRPSSGVGAGVEEGSMT
ncbi:MAG: hypothetical protein LQ343_001385 [Gyalolechia ehrenbergii]|nr:MAG: hypothetical protein LQ343_001385 [Gyalolechia ehrenbergii]